MHIIGRSPDGIHTAILTYRNGPKELILVGMLHWAEHSFFKAAQEYIDARFARGYGVLYEEMHIPSREPDALFDEVVALNHEVYARCGLCYQSDGDAFAIRPGWTCGDPIASETMDSWMNDPSRRERLVRAKQDALDYLAHPHEWRVSYEAALTNMADKDALGIFPGAFSNPGEEHVLIHARNDAAYPLIAQHLENGPALTCWGALHLYGFAERLEADGFELIAREWLCALSSNPSRK